MFSSDAQRQTQESFGFKWSKTETYEGDHFLQDWKVWLLEKYFDGDMARIEALLSGENLKILDPGCWMWCRRFQSVALWRAFV